MHDPDVVAFDIPAPALRRVRLPGLPVNPRWGILARRRTDPENVGERVYPWWRPRGYQLHLGGHRYRSLTLATIWHREPGGRDSGEICKHYSRDQQPDGTWTTTVLHGWRWHVHHWRIQVGALQALRRRLLTRCAWCAGRSREGDPVNNSPSWDGERGPWWRGERDLFHASCMSVSSAHQSCTCPAPVLDHDTWGTCARCNLRRSHGRTDAQTIRLRELKQCGTGERPPATARPRR